MTDCEVRLREHLRALSGSTAKVDVLAEILAEDIAAWPSDGWLVIDDYHEIVGAEEAEHLVAALVAAAPVQLLIASASADMGQRAQILYDEVLELNQTTLAMNAGEASEVLAGRSPPSASGLVALANGWPAVIGLASVTTAEIEDSEQLPEALYRFFAEEVFEALDDEVKAGLATLAVLPSSTENWRWSCSASVPSTSVAPPFGWVFSSNVGSSSSCIHSLAPFSRTDARSLEALPRPVTWRDASGTTGADATGMLLLTSSPVIDSSIRSSHSYLRRWMSF